MAALAKSRACMHASRNIKQGCTNARVGVHARQHIHTRPAPDEVHAVTCLHMTTQTSNEVGPGHIACWLLQALAASAVIYPQKASNTEDMQPAPDSGARQPHMNPLLDQPGSCQITTLRASITVFFQCSPLWPCTSANCTAFCSCPKSSMEVRACKPSRTDPKLDSVSRPADH
eukprot:6208457-Pleurochrysis_carterae.AAC.4